GSVSVRSTVAGIDAGAFAAPETGAGTRGRAALAAATAGDLKRAARLGGTLDETSGAAALALAAVELLARVGDDKAVAAAVRIVSGAGGKLAAVRQRLLARAGSDARVAALAQRLGGNGNG
ncbi:MAG TPA: hypothetical protein VF997_03805, partial [Polyangia bacterium]